MNRHARLLRSHHSALVIGLGLAMARSAVEAQGGRLWAESVVGQGTAFIVSLPRVLGDEASGHHVP